ncbi:MAG: hypothetical protein V1833_01825 [Elusimicrobiota bacterium]
MKKYFYLSYLLLVPCYLLLVFTGCERKKELFGTKAGLISIVSPITVPTTATGVPTGLTATAGNQQVTLSWNYVNNTNYYKIYRSYSAGGPYLFISNMYSMNTYTDYGVTNGTMYYYKVSAVDWYNNESGLSNYIGVTPTTTSGGDSYEPDNGFSSSKYISVSAYSISQSRSIQPAGDYDYIEFYAYAGYNYTFYTTGTTDTYATLYNSSYESLSSDDNSWDGSRNFKINWNCPSAGTYYLVIRGYNTSTTTGAYTLYYSYYY